jgi:N utilization substance protein A
MNADFLAVLEFWEREKGISKDVLVAAVQEALVSAAKKAVGPARELRCAIDPKTGDIRAFAKLVVSEKVSSKHDQISVFDARRIKADAQLGEEVEVEVTPAGFGRIASQYAKQALMQHIRRAEKALIFAEFKDRVGDIVSGVVRRFERSDVHVDAPIDAAQIVQFAHQPLPSPQPHSAAAPIAEPTPAGDVRGKLAW